MPLPAQPPPPLVLREPEARRRGQVLRVLLPAQPPPPLVLRELEAQRGGLLLLLLLLRRPCASWHRRLACCRHARHQHLACAEQASCSS